VEAKAIYSIEKFLVARRIMYWQVYLHKTAVSAEKVLINILKRAKELAKQGSQLFYTRNLGYFIEQNCSLKDFEQGEALQRFALLDDFDIIASIKEWAHHSDKILSQLSKMLLNRNLYKIEVQKAPFSEQTIQNKKSETAQKLNLTDSETIYFVGSGKLTNRAYNPKAGRINIVFKDGTVKDIAEAADLLSISEMSKEVEKYYLYYPKNL
ncbi:MAG: phosphohydrolase, partial [Bacteroidetes bacterium]